MFEEIFKKMANMEGIDQYLKDFAYGWQNANWKMITGVRWFT